MIKTFTKDDIGKKLDHIDLYKNILNTPKEHQITLAKFFAEGNQELEDLLLYCWDMGIETLACCAGHLPKEDSTPYINFNIDKKNRIASMMEYLNSCKDIVVEYWINIDEKLKKDNFSSVSFRLAKKNKNLTCQDISYLFKKVKESIDIKCQPSELILKILNISNFNYEIDQEESKKTLGFSYPATIGVNLIGDKIEIMTAGIKGHKTHFFEETSLKELEEIINLGKSNTKWSE